MLIGLKIIPIWTMLKDLLYNDFKLAQCIFIQQFGHAFQNQNLCFQCHTF
ncbi:hypothetical protein T4E_4303 [Trichinella pseudospiralis]|uniref:Uncharacterized protein n=1 Tax=Trichinella pseudospiralis TaxID=6337 RepID=A0A0V0XD44_TRIPS|nr:hypothetical protein T4E_4303 [Trichinella pseudospiralis]